MSNYHKKPAFKVTDVFAMYAPAIVRLCIIKKLLDDEKAAQVHGDMLEIFKLMLQLVRLYCRSNTDCTADRLFVDSHVCFFRCSRTYNSHSLQEITSVRAMTAV